MTKETTHRAERRWILPLLLLGSVGLVRSAAADPCGMVPPIYTGQGLPIERVGAQKTYVFYKNGVESIAIRPGFKGKVDQFGMLIPFPAVPDLRKLPDEFFSHVQSAIDPPEVVMYVRRYWPRRRGRMYAPSAAKSAGSGGGGLRYDQVRVLKQEAVGMYEVAVLAAGSAKALQRWMDQHNYKYPKGMDEPCNDYVRMGWCFVAVKTRVGQKKGVNPRPGMRRVNDKLPPGATFKGAVQAMGFRFRTRKIVVPMRLSAFNAGRLRNIVYVLSDRPRRIDQIASKYVMRQVRGVDIFRNLTGPLPLRVIGGTIKDLRSYQLQNLKQRRDPRPFTEHAAELFASDLLAVRRGRLSHPYEEQKKALLEIGERLMLRGKAIDALNRQVLDKAKKSAIRTALRDVKQMTLSVIDGDFQRDVLAKQNLTFGAFRMPRDRNNKRSYDARREGPGSNFQQGGKLYRGALDAPPKTQKAQTKAAGSVLVVAGPWVALAALGLLGLVVLWRRRRAATLLGLLVVTIAAPGRAQAATVPELIKDLGHKDRVKQRGAVKQLVQQGKQALRPLLNEAFDGTNPVRRGWALVAIGEIGDASVDGELQKLHTNPNHPMLIRTWAAAVRIKLAKGTQGLLALAPLSSSFPALQRPLGRRLARAFAGKRGPKAAEQMIEATTRLYQLRSVLAPAIVALGAKPLVKVLLTSKNQNVRRNAAAYLGTLARTDYQGVATRVARAYRFRKQAQKVPWDGGPLFLPGLSWKRPEARKLVGALIRWHVWADLKQDSSLQKQIHNNLRSLSLAQVVGYQSPGWREVNTERWIEIWGKVIGRDKMRALLMEQGWGTYRRYKTAVDRL